MSAYDDAIDRYISAWGMADAATRLATLRGCCAPDMTYRDPSATVEGLPALSDHIARTQASFPGCALARTSRVDAHGPFARFGWQMRCPDGRNLPESLDVVEIGPDGRIRHVIGFFGSLKPV